MTAPNYKKCVKTPTKLFSKSGSFRRGLSVNDVELYVAPTRLSVGKQQQVTDMPLE